VSAASEETKLLRAALAALEEPPLASALPDDQRTARMAQVHRLSPLLSSVCGGHLPGGLAAACRRDRLVTVARNLVLGDAAAEVLRAFAALAIPTIVLKGLDYEIRLYTAPGSRPTGDVDLLVPQEHRQAAFQGLLALGYEPRAAAPGFDDADYHEVAWTRAGIEVDLHLRLAPPARCRIDHAAIWAHAEPAAIGGAEARVLRAEHAAIFHALHMAIDHFEVPAIYLVDLARLVSSVPDVARLLGLADEWRCRKVLATALALSGEFLPRWREAHRSVLVALAADVEVVTHYGALERLSRPRQLWRKLRHFDRSVDAAAYFALQSRRNLREQLEKHVRKRTPRQRLGL
jgi:hypothetical protein